MAISSKLKILSSQESFISTPLNLRSHHKLSSVFHCRLQVKLYNIPGQDLNGPVQIYMIDNPKKKNNKS